MSDEKLNKAIENDFLTNWKTNTGMTILGIFINLLLTTFSRGVSNTASGLLASCVLCLIFYGLAIWYCTSKYRSLFSDNPKSASSTSISFLNGLFGNVIFGCIWNSNLTNRNKGISWIVYTVFSCIAIAYSLWALVVVFG